MNSITDKPRTAEHATLGQTGPTTRCQNSVASPCGIECAFGIDCAADRAARTESAAPTHEEQHGSGETDAQGCDGQQAETGQRDWRLPPDISGKEEDYDTDTITISAYEAHTRRLATLCHASNRWLVPATLAGISGLTFVALALISHIH